MDGDDWLETTVPGLYGMGFAGLNAADQLAWFETERRATMLILALEAYRLDHGNLPKSLNELAGKYFEDVPHDPYSGLEFQYFPEGLPKPQTPTEGAEFVNWRPIDFGVPGIWSTGSQLVLGRQFLGPDEKTVVGYDIRRRTSSSDVPLPFYPAFNEGIWFPIPETPK